MTNRYCEICESKQPSFTPKCYIKEDKDMQPQVCKKCHANFCCDCQLKAFRDEFGSRRFVMTIGDKDN